MRAGHDGAVEQETIGWPRILAAFTRLGLTSFGGPVAHLGYFREAFVVRRRWLNEADYADLVALCQLLPGPTSSQVGFAIGLTRGGWAGALAAFAGFTWPSVLILLLFAAGLGLLGPAAVGALHGLKLVAVAIVAQAVFGMARSLTPDAPRLAVAVTAALIVALVGGAAGQLGAILFGAFAGLALVRAGRAPLPAAGGTVAVPVSPRVGSVLLVLAFALLALLPLARAADIGGHGLALFDAFYRAGALVFGGGHVVLPLLKESVVDAGWVSPDAFLAGYGAAQAVPGPLFSLAAYLGWIDSGALGAALALAALFLPGLLLVAGALARWRAIAGHTYVRAALVGVNAAVVGLLAAALYDPVWTGSVRTIGDAALAAAGFVALVLLRVPALAVVVSLAALGALL